MNSIQYCPNWQNRTWEYRPDRVTRWSVNKVALYPETTTQRLVYSVNLPGVPGLQTVKRSSGHELNVRRATNLQLGKNLLMLEMGSTCYYYNYYALHLFITSVVTAVVNCSSNKGSSICYFWFLSSFAASGWICAPGVASLHQQGEPLRLLTAHVLLSGRVSDWMMGIMNDGQSSPKIPKMQQKCLLYFFIGPNTLLNHILKVLSRRWSGIYIFSRLKGKVFPNTISKLSRIGEILFSSWVVTSYQRKKGLQVA